MKKNKIWIWAVLILLVVGSAVIYLISLFKKKNDTQVTNPITGNSATNDSGAVNELTKIINTLKTQVQSLLSKDSTNTSASTTALFFIDDAPALTEKIRGIFYIPRLSPSMDFWQELKKGTISWTDISTDLDQLKALTNINTIRVFTYYDYEFRNAYNALIASGKSISEANTTAMATAYGWTDGKGAFNENYMDYLQQFIDLCAARDIEVMITMFQELPALKVTDNWDFLENDIEHYKNFTQWFVNGIKGNSNVRIINLMNEPDGYGVWGNEAIASRVLRFLQTLKVAIKEIKPSLKVMVTSTTHDNNFCRFPSAPTNCNSIYELTDIVAVNSFLFADTGFRSQVDYKAQFDYIVSKNSLKKPMLLSECGFPSHYGQQEVEGFEILNEDGTASGTGNASFTRSSIVPIGGIFDRPKGTFNGIAHSVENQERSINEAFYWAEHYNFMGGLVWSAYDHTSNKTENVYRDAFGIIAKDGTPTPSVTVLKNAFQAKTNDLGKKHISLNQGDILVGSGRINGKNPFNEVFREKNTPNGIFLEQSAIWQSDDLPYNTPIRYNISFKLRDTLTVDEILVFSLMVGNVKVIDYRYKRYTVNAFQKINPDQEVNYGFSQAVAMPIGQVNTIGLELHSLKPKAYFNGVALAFEDDTFQFEPWMLSSIKVKVRNLSNSNLDILRLEAQTQTANQTLILT